MLHSSAGFGYCCPFKDDNEKALFHNSGMLSFYSCQFDNSCPETYQVLQLFWDVLNFKRNLSRRVNYAYLARSFALFIVRFRIIYFAHANSLRNVVSFSLWLISYITVR